MKVNYIDVEEKMREFVHRSLKNRTGAFLDYVDQMLTAPGTTIAQAEQFNRLKSRGKSMFMECQDEILMGTKCLMETGEIPAGIDKRGPVKD